MQGKGRYSNFLTYLTCTCTLVFLQCIYSPFNSQVDKQPQRDKNHVAHLYFVVFVLFGSFFVLNLFVGVIIDNFNRLQKEYESGAVGLFLTESQKAWYDTLKKAASKKPRKVAKRPKVERIFYSDNEK